MRALIPRCSGGRVHWPWRDLALMTALLAGGCTASVTDPEEALGLEGDASPVEVEVEDEDKPSGGRDRGGSAGTVGNRDASAAAEDGDAGILSPNRDASETTLPGPAEGLVPMFVAAGNGGRTVTSCDDGMTWVANHQYEDRNEDHSSYTHKGFAFGNGWFVSLMGWGADSSLKISNDGVTWKRIPMLPNRNYTALGFDGQQFGLIGNDPSASATDPSGPWTRGASPKGSLRGGGGGGPPEGRGALIGSGNPPVMSWDGGRTWSPAAGCPGMVVSNLGQRGNAVYGAGVLLIVSENGDICRVSDGGKTKESGQLPGKVIGKATRVEDRFIVVSDAVSYVSADGIRWETKAFAPKDTKLRMLAKSPSGSYVAIGDISGVFYRSSDAINWTRVQGPSGPTLIDLQFGYGRRSATCPGQ